MTIEPEDVEADREVTVDYYDKPEQNEWSDELREAVEDEKVAGWKVDESSPDRVVMVNRDIGGLGAHTIVFIFFFWTAGLGNLLYGLYRYFGCAEKKVLRS